MWRNLGLSVKSSKTRHISVPIRRCVAWILVLHLLCVFQLRVDGDSEGAILEGVQDDKEYQISLSALYADGAQSEAVAIRYSTCEFKIHTLSQTWRC